MNNRVLKIVAGLLALGAVGVAFLGVKLSQQPSPPRPALPSSPPPAPTASAVVALRALRAGQPIAVTDVAVRAVSALPDKAYTAAPEVIGRAPSVDIASGEVVKTPQFASGSLASLLRVGERAVAIRVDEVIGLGGFAAPGDRVDVLLYVQPSRETGERSLSRLVIQDARLLTMGDASLLSDDSAATNTPATGTGVSGSSLVGGDASRKASQEKRSSQRSAVLALSEADATRLMLASSAGQLRLSLRPQVADSATSASPASSAPMVSLSDLTGTPAAAPSAKRTAAARSGIIFNEGDKVRTMSMTHSEAKP